MVSGIINSMLLMSENRKYCTESILQSPYNYPKVSSYSSLYTLLSFMNFCELPIMAELIFFL